MRCLVLMQVIMTHGYSRVVMQALLTAVKTHGKRVRVYVTESRPSGQGLRTYERLRAEGIPCSVVVDTAVAYVIDRVDLCLVGAEAVAESGGIFNAIGSYQLSIIAKAAKKPVFALAERCAMLLTTALNSCVSFPYRSTMSLTRRATCRCRPRKKTWACRTAYIARQPWKRTTP